MQILMLGAPLPIVENPLRLAEELAMIDCISRGRLIAGVVRGGGVEILANNVNPAHNRERFEEAHDLMIAAWTRPGPFRWEGKHFEYRVVNPWVLPLQKPHPRDHGAGHRQSGDGHLGSAAPVSVCRAGVVAGADERADRAVPRHRRRSRLRDAARPYRLPASACSSPIPRNARRTSGHNFFWQNGALSKQPREWMAPPGYASIDFAGMRRLRAVSKPFDDQAYQEAQDNYQVVLGTPDQVTEKLRYIRDELGIGHMCLWAQDGYIRHEDTVRCIELFGNEVLPALKAEEPTSTLARNATVS